MIEAGISKSCSVVREQSVTIGVTIEKERCESDLQKITKRRANGVNE